MKNIRREDWESLEPTVHGWGIVDVNYVIAKKENYINSDGKQIQKRIWICPYYEDWCNMIRRCFDKNYQETNPTYKGCTIDPDWRYLSKFIEWVDSQPNKDWGNMSPDKDLLVIGNKHYCSETVVYVDKLLNTFVTDSAGRRGDLFIGVKHTSSKKKSYSARCNNPFTGKQEYLGVFATELEAHKAWQAKKHEHALRLADEQDDPRVAKVLRERYAPDKDWTKS